MLRNISCRRVATLLIASAGIFATMGFGSASQSVGLSLEVPLLCRVNFEVGAGAFNADGVASLGSTQEFCNAAGGYKVYARAEGADTGATLIVNGQRHSIASGQEFVIVDSEGPARISRQISLDAGAGEGGGRVTMRIEAQ